MFPISRTPRGLPSVDMSFFRRMSQRFSNDANDEDAEGEAVPNEALVADTKPDDIAAAESAQNDATSKPTAGAEPVPNEAGADARPDDVAATGQINASEVGVLG